jgi:copper(I)-binding protein
MNFLRTFTVLAVMFAAISSSFAETFENIEISDIWARPSLGKQKNSAIYMNMLNKGSEEDQLIKAETDIAGKTVFHQSGEEDGVMKMIHVDQVSVPKNLTVQFKPKGLHVMLINLKQNLKEGDKFTLGLTFEKAGYTEIEVPVRAMSQGNSGDNSDKSKSRSPTESEKNQEDKPFKAL